MLLHVVLVAGVIAGNGFRHGMAASGGAEFYAAFPQARKGTLAVGAVINTRIGTTITPVRFAVRSGGAEFTNSYGCGVMLGGSVGASQAVVVIGTGDTQALTCNKMLSAGVVVPRGGKPELALIYDVSSPTQEARDFVLLRRDRGGRWVFDNARADRLADHLPDKMTIADIRRALAGER